MSRRSKPASGPGRPVAGRVLAPPNLGARVNVKKEDSRDFLDYFEPDVDLTTDASHSKEESTLPFGNNEDWLIVDPRTTPPSTTQPMAVLHTPAALGTSQKLGSLANSTASDKNTDPGSKPFSREHRVDNGSASDKKHREDAGRIGHVAADAGSHKHVGSVGSVGGGGSAWGRGGGSGTGSGGSSSSELLSIFGSGGDPMELFTAVPSPRTRPKQNKDWFDDENCHLPPPPKPSATPVPAQNLFEDVEWDPETGQMGWTQHHRGKVAQARVVGTQGLTSSDELERKELEDHGRPVHNERADTMFTTGHQSSTKIVVEPDLVRSLDATIQEHSTDDLLDADDNGSVSPEGNQKAKKEAASCAIVDDLSSKDPMWLKQHTQTLEPDVQGSHPPGSHLPGSHPPGSHPPGSHPPGSHLPGSHPPGSHLPGSHPPGSHPPGSHPPGSHPPGSHPQGSRPPAGEKFLHLPGRTECEVQPSLDTLAVSNVSGGSTSSATLHKALDSSKLAQLSKEAHVCGVPELGQHLPFNGGAFSKVSAFGVQGDPFPQQHESLHPQLETTYPYMGPSSAAMMDQSPEAIAPPVEPLPEAIDPSPEAVAHLVDEHYEAMAPCASEALVLPVDHLSGAAAPPLSEAMIPSMSEVTTPAVDVTTIPSMSEAMIPSMSEVTTPAVAVTTILSMSEATVPSMDGAVLPHRNPFPETINPLMDPTSDATLTFSEVPISSLDAPFGDVTLHAIKPSKEEASVGLIPGANADVTLHAIKPSKEEASVGLIPGANADVTLHAIKPSKEEASVGLIPGANADDLSTTVSSYCGPALSCADEPQPAIVLGPTQTHHDFKILRSVVGIVEPSGCLNAVGASNSVPNFSEELQATEQLSLSPEKPSFLQQNLSLDQLTGALSRPSDISEELCYVQKESALDLSLDLAQPPNPTIVSTIEPSLRPTNLEPPLGSNTPEPSLGSSNIEPCTGSSVNGLMSKPLEAAVDVVMSHPLDDHFEPLVHSKLGFLSQSLGLPREAGPSHPLGPREAGPSHPLGPFPEASSLSGTAYSTTVTVGQPATTTTWQPATMITGQLASCGNITSSGLPASSQPLSSAFQPHSQALQSPCLPSDMPTQGISPKKPARPPLSQHMVRMLQDKRGSLGDQVTAPLPCKDEPISCSLSSSGPVTEHSALKGPPTLPLPFQVKKMGPGALPQKTPVSLQGAQKGSLLTVTSSSLSMSSASLLGSSLPLTSSQAVPPQLANQAINSPIVMSQPTPASQISSVSSSVSPSIGIVTQTVGFSGPPSSQQSVSTSAAFQAVAALSSSQIIPSSSVATLLPSSSTTTITTATTITTTAATLPPKSLQSTRSGNSTPKRSPSPTPSTNLETKTISATLESSQLAITQLSLLHEKPVVTQLDTKEVLVGAHSDPLAMGTSRTTKIQSPRLAEASKPASLLTVNTELEGAEKKVLRSEAGTGLVSAVPSVTQSGPTAAALASCAASRDAPFHPLTMFEMPLQYHLVAAAVLYVYYSLNIFGYLSGLLTGFYLFYLLFMTMFVFVVHNMDETLKRELKSQPAQPVRHEVFEKVKGKIRNFESKEFLVTTGYDYDTPKGLGEKHKSEIKLLNDFNLTIRLYNIVNNQPQVFFSTKQNIRQCDVCLVPAMVAEKRRRRWNKKYPIRIILTETSAHRELFLFSSTARLKEEWYRRLREAKEGKDADTLIKQRERFLRYIQRYFPRKAPVEVSAAAAPNTHPGQEGSGMHFVRGKEEGEPTRLPAPAASVSSVSSSSGSVRYENHSSLLHKKQQPWSSQEMSSVSSPATEGSVDTNSWLPTALSTASQTRKEMDWLNVFIARLCWDLWHEDFWNKWTKNRIQTVLSRVSTPPFMEKLQVTDVKLGMDTPVINKLVDGPILDPDGVWAYLDITYVGSFTMTIETKLKLTLDNAGEDVELQLEPVNPSKTRLKSLHDPLKGTSVDTESENSDDDGTQLEPLAPLPLSGLPANGQAAQAEPPPKHKRLLGMVSKVAKMAYTKSSLVRRAAEKVSSYPLVLTVIVKRLDGVVAVNIPPPPSDTIWLGFRESPKLDLTATPQVGQKALTISKVTHWIEDKLRELVKEKLVLPNMEDLVIPVLSSGFPEDKEKITPLS